MKHFYYAPYQAYQLVQRRARKKQARSKKLQRFRAIYYRLFIHSYPRGKHRERNHRPAFHEYLTSIRSKPVVVHSEVVKFWMSRQAKMGSLPHLKLIRNTLHIPTIFSLSDEAHQAEGFRFIHHLFNTLYHQRVTDLRIDYEHCERIDVDAQVCMDVLLREFRRYFKECDRQGVHRTLQQIQPVAFNNLSIAKVLFSIGGFKLFNNFDVSFPDVIPYPLQTGDRRHKDSSKQRDLEITRTVDYVVECLKQIHRELTPAAETLLYKVVGEVLINASEHATTNYRYLAGYFLKQPQGEGVLGVLQLVVMNFGDTIYEKFKDPDCPNQAVVQQMQKLSETYTRKRWFSNAEFQEETLWTLYALQEGVTSHTNWKRGNGSIRFIDSFFGLKGDTEFDNLSSMTILSGNTRIIFDGTYQIETKTRVRNGESHGYKVMPFNQTADIEEQPDKKFVKFVPDYFPGTMLSAKICIKQGNTEPLL